MTMLLLDLFFAGMETTVTTLKWGFLLTTLHPEVSCIITLDSCLSGPGESSGRTGSEVYWRVCNPCRSAEPPLYSGDHQCESIWVSYRLFPSGNPKNGQHSSDKPAENHVGRGTNRWLCLSKRNLCHSTDLHSHAGSLCFWTNENMRFRTKVSSPRRHLSIRTDFFPRTVVCFE